MQELPCCAHSLVRAWQNIITATTFLLLFFLSMVQGFFWTTYFLFFSSWQVFLLYFGNSCTGDTQRQTYHRLFGKQCAVFSLLALAQFSDVTRQKGSWHFFLPGSFLLVCSWCFDVFTPLKLNSSPLKTYQNPIEPFFRVCAKPREGMFFQHFCWWCLCLRSTFTSNPEERHVTFSLDPNTHQKI